VSLSAAPRPSAIPWPGGRSTLRIAKPKLYLFVFPTSSNNVSAPVAHRISCEFSTVSATLDRGSPPGARNPPISGIGYANARTPSPELFSDSRLVEQPRLTREVFEYHLETLTSRKQEIEFEAFCRRLAEKELCPNLLPQTGPTGGGDSKVDSSLVGQIVNLRADC
jgi:hypothetical protein